MGHVGLRCLGTSKKILAPAQQSNLDWRPIQCCVILSVDAETMEVDDIIQDKYSEK